MSPKQFRIEIIEGLLAGWSAHVPMRCAPLHSVVKITGPMALNLLLPAVNICNLHSIMKIKGGRAYCEYCSSKANRTRTSYYCGKCEKFMCATCFMPYHSDIYFSSLVHFV